MKLRFNSRLFNVRYEKQVRVPVSLVGGWLGLALILGIACLLALFLSDQVLPGFTSVGDESRWQASQRHTGLPDIDDLERYVRRVWRRWKALPDWQMLMLLAGSVASVIVCRWIAIFTARQVRRQVPLRCERCEHPMNRVAAKAMERHLNKHQILEQALGSISYDVWQCTDCDRHQLRETHPVFTKYKPCTKCGYRTASEEQLTLRKPTYEEVGKRRITVTCQACKHKRARLEKIPKLTYSSS